MPSFESKIKLSQNSRLTVSPKQGTTKFFRKQEPSESTVLLGIVGLRFWRLHFLIDYVFPSANHLEKELGIKNVCQKYYRRNKGRNLRRDNDRRTLTKTSTYNVTSDQSYLLS
ncbi:hypothetical protein CEXT_189941 [Caerostris extrusa]|uniref:PiggyBac transposable element-derived protein domain-containing protein n=1 Tax=Caerostris extrusa TaxID=172846 RepID=A0AAV4RBB2_CAEEX|nr:hypothetical protein CEXT_189941 [Caerostris extrusa]